MKINAKTAGKDLGFATQSADGVQTAKGKVIHDSEVRDVSLAPSGERKIAWAWRNMPLLRAIKKDFEKTKPFKGVNITLSIHMEAKTACLCRTLAAGGAKMYAAGCNPL